MQGSEQLADDCSWGGWKRHAGKASIKVRDACHDKYEVAVSAINGEAEGVLSIVNPDFGRIAIAFPSLQKAKAVAEAIRDAMEVEE